MLEHRCRGRLLIPALEVVVGIGERRVGPPARVDGHVEVRGEIRELTIVEIDDRGLVQSHVGWRLKGLRSSPCLLEWQF